MNNETKNIAIPVDYHFELKVKATMAGKGITQYLVEILEEAFSK